MKYYNSTCVKWPPFLGSWQSQWNSLGHNKFFWGVVFFLFKTEVSCLYRFVVHRFHWYYHVFQVACLIQNWNAKLQTIMWLESTKLRCDIKVLVDSSHILVCSFVFRFWTDQATWKHGIKNVVKQRHSFCWSGVIACRWSLWWFIFDLLHLYLICKHAIVIHDHRTVYTHTHTSHSQPKCKHKHLPITYTNNRWVLVWITCTEAYLLLVVLWSMQIWFSQITHSTIIYVNQASSVCTGRMVPILPTERGRAGGTASILPLYVTWEGNDVSSRPGHLCGGCKPSPLCSKPASVNKAPSANQVSSVNQAHL